MTDDDKAGKGILDQLIEEAFKKGAISATQDDFAVNLSTTDKDGKTHSVEGIPVSQAKKFLYDNFGLGEPPADDKGDDKGDDKNPGKPTLKSYFGGKSAAS